ncbi:aldo/keto reductase [Limosilactobacillus agrestis]|uniref:aldo/keto reductase n=1 Tax=Limosilactobacillus agrestis TaxID=2759748 RepID=UPI001E518C4F|nr:aldo/keto reductase [Limosilactobacillus agrestis]MCD7120059.1 aldo/keto reductase [Limosilactobacillus agrestis]
MMNLDSINSPVKLNNGLTIPVVGYGTFRTPADVTEQAVSNALKVGYRHIDASTDYGNEQAVGRAIHHSGIDRKDLFVTSKLPNDQRGYDSTKKMVQKSLDTLGLDYLDLYLIHWPATPAHYGDQADQVNADTWRALEELYHAGKVRSIGVSNFLPHHMETLLKTATVVPAVDQIEVHPGWPQADTVKYLQNHQITVEAWGPLGGKGATVLTNSTLQAIGAKYGKSNAQVALRWILQQGIIPLPKSVHEDRLRQNMDIFDFQLTTEEMTTISQLHDLGGQCADPDAYVFWKPED